MSCYISYETIDGHTVVVRNFTGDVSINLTSATNGGAGYVPPACSSSAEGASHSVPEPATAVLLVSALVLGALSMRIRPRRGTKPG